MLKKNSKILVTGANGLLGTEIVANLCQNHTIYALTRRGPVQNDKIHYIECDLATDWDVSILPEDIDVVIHLAQSSKFREFPDQANDIFNVNIASTSKLLDFSYRNNVKQFVYASSGGIYGTNQNAFDEDSIITPKGDLGFYLGSKLCGEVLVSNYSKLMNVVTLRFFFMYSAQQNKQMLIPRLVDNVKAGKSILLQGKEGIVINPVHVTDASKAVEKALELKGSFVFNVGGSESLTIREIAMIIGDVFDKKPNFKEMDEVPKNIIGNIDGMKANLHKPTISFRSGIEEFYNNEKF